MTFWAPESKSSDQHLFFSGGRKLHTEQANPPPQGLRPHRDHITAQILERNNTLAPARPWLNKRPGAQQRTTSIPLNPPLLRGALDYMPKLSVLNLFQTFHHNNTVIWVLTLPPLGSIRVWQRGDIFPPGPRQRRCENSRTGRAGVQLANGVYCVFAGAGESHCASNQFAASSCHLHECKEVIHAILLYSLSHSRAHLIVMPVEYVFFGGKGGYITHLSFL